MNNIFESIRKEYRYIPTKLAKELGCSRMAIWQWEKEGLTKKAKEVLRNFFERRGMANEWIEIIIEREKEKERKKKRKRWSIKTP